MENNQQSVGAGQQMELIKRRRQEIPDAERVQNLVNSLYQKAKQEKQFRFYVLYDKMFIPYMLREAFQHVKSNGGSAGVDGKSIADIESYGVEQYLKELGEELRKRTYKPSAVKRVMIPKPDGGERPLGIPTVKDRIAQTVCKMILEPIYEADFEENSFGFRPGRKTQDAVANVKEQLKSGKTEVLDADLSKFFDTIPHDKLMLTLQERIADPRILKLIYMWLKAPVQDKSGISGGKKNDKGTPQGGVISPLLANVYLHLMDRNINNPRSLFSMMGVKLVRYADDFVLMGNHISDEVIEKLQSLLKRMGLVLNEAKTKRVDAKEESFNFLGFTIRYSKDLFVPNKKYWEIVPSKKSEKKVRRKIWIYLASHSHLPAMVITKDLNAIIRGWLNNFDCQGLSYAAMSKRRLRIYLINCIYKNHCRKSQRSSKIKGLSAFEDMVRTHGLIDPTKYILRPTQVNA
jgi:RNA-directed DNA polymerase